ncbi:MAG: glutamate synthase-related protein, partial [Propionibacteriales bacterium]|nr:glutamate synthase-related protein [Propionibacteriales bacterium]
MRVCHLDTCPVGVATQNPELRKKFTGQPEFVITFFEFLAEQVRDHLAALGFRSLDEAIGHSEVLDTVSATQHWKAHGLDLTPLLHRVELPEGAALRRVTGQDHALEQSLDTELIKLAQPALDEGRAVVAAVEVRNVHRTVGTRLGYEVTRRTGGEGLAPDTIDLTLTGSGGQSFGAFLPAGITLRLVGDSNDYVGKGLSGGRIIVRPAINAAFRAEENIIAGNVIGYGATSGEIFLRGLVGERFCVRNSGALAVVEGVGDHGCEYMTGGEVVVLGPTGRNFAAGMSGGMAYLLDADLALINPELVDGLGLEEADRSRLHTIVTAHALETESTVARALLADWDEAVRRFTKVVPRDWARVVAVAQRAEAAGLGEDETTRQMMAAAHG